MRILAAYLATAVVLAGLDLTWLRLSANTLYHPQLGGLLAERTNNIAALAFYLIYVAGIVGFGIMPALESGSLPSAVVRGALLGIFAYATYDLTNLATLRSWPLLLSLIDMVWGTLLTAVSAGAGAFAAGLVSR